MNNQKLRVWWIPQIGIEKTFYIPVESAEEGQKIIDLLAAYDCFEYNQNVKPDYCNTGGLEVFDEESGEWEDWYYDGETCYFDSTELDEYCRLESERATEIENFRNALYEQVEFS